LVIVDDGSDKEHQIYDVHTLFPELKIELIRLEKDKKWRGAVVAYNTGFKAAKGDGILINSSECVHMGAIIEYAFYYLEHKNYISFSAYEAREEETKKLCDFDWETPIVTNKLFEIFEPFNHWWRSHPTNVTLIPYCAAIRREDMEQLNGYDERFIDGIGFDDYDFVDRVKNLGLKTTLVDDPFCVHQHHKPTEYTNTKNLDLWQRLAKEHPKRIRAEQNIVYNVKPTQK
jgi:GT2 family glycosyltransferase